MDGLDLPAADREALLAERCGNDLELRREVESLLHTGSAGGLPRPDWSRSTETR
jgi:hypothetical protein